MMSPSLTDLQHLAGELAGALHFDATMRTLYATDASVYRETKKLLGDAGNRAEIAREFPKKSIHRRNPGYTIDLLADCAPFTSDGPPFNFCRLFGRLKCAASKT